MNEKIKAMPDRPEGVSPLTVALAEKANTADICSAKILEITASLEV